MLAGLTAGAVEDAEARAAERPLAVVERDALAQSPARDALAALAPAERVRIIAEVKRASPSRGDLAAIPDPALQAARYEEGGASVISVLTEGRRFKGSLADLEAVRAEVSIPVLRKDFIANPYQVFEARAAGADLVLLIVAALEQPLLAELHELVLELGMTPLVETHSLDEVHRAADIGARLVGVNARNLSTFELDRDLFGRLVEHLPADAVKIAESAVLTPHDVAHYRRAGADAVLIGEALVTNDPVTTLHAFLEAGA
ncbi:MULTISPECIES: indole-3-glycerol phosphate synthase TrpC [Microbacterium]|uniref:indole-3-glycerol phosphate synthase TrpC n=1 Tax=Microbacterium TaxID=33882 RepID=UPI000E72DCF5|nr:MULTISPECIES: indole-3-glycerol phosphate synthase TrpC [Microbacterium]MDF2578641.1 indole-3-glycerol phosphate synthase [Microbacterium sp.]RKE63030.1 indole-3-glycerol phosphate synthase [Microbacterium sp. AG238]WJM14359.1 indole-3-glycerol phosphate synthase TrpC [Microbacterium arborescens]